jgi:metal-sulfur cluster biosynthetic enzyme
MRKEGLRWYHEKKSWTCSEEIEVDFTLTYPGCPAEEIIRRDIMETVRDAFGIATVRATTVWTPLWGPERMSEEARVALGYPI